MTRAAEGAAAGVARVGGAACNMRRGRMKGKGRKEEVVEEKAHRALP